MYREIPILSIFETTVYRYAVRSPRSGLHGDRTVITIIDLNAELAKLRMLQRTPATTRADREGSAARLAPYRDGGIFASKSARKGGWERHPNGDELVQVLDGETKFHIITEDGKQTHTLKAGILVVVPQGAWHRFEAPDGVCLMTATPKPTEHLTVDVEDPRSLSEGQRSGNTEEKWR